MRQLELLGATFLATLASVAARLVVQRPEAPEPASRELMTIVDQLQDAKFDLFKTDVRPWGMPCTRPVKRAPVVFPPNLVLGDASDQVMYSGYVNVTERDHLFYWFAEAQQQAAHDAPIIVWSNGGPGCTAMEGMTTEHGPLILYGVKEEDGQFSGKLSKNPFSWNRKAHVLYVDQPRYVGYSCGTGPFVTGSREAGRDMVTFLRGWRLLFPEHVHRKIILATESYGGHYVPAWSDAILEYNAAGATDPINLIGLIIGNGIVNDTIQGNSFPAFAKRKGLIPGNMAAGTTKEARQLMTRYLGYKPNYYDYRLVEKECCGCSSYDYNGWAKWHLREDVTKALNVCGNAGAKAFGNCAAGCISLPDFDKDDTFDYSGALGRALRDGIRVTLYYGMQDTVCNYVGGYDMALALPWPGAYEFARAPFQDLIIGGVSNGKVKVTGGLTWVEVEGAGHMVPINNPLAASFAIETVIPGAGLGSCATASSHDKVSPTTPSHGKRDIAMHLRALRLLYARGRDGGVFADVTFLQGFAALTCASLAIAIFLALALRRKEQRAGPRSINVGVSVQELMRMKATLSQCR
jgi:carboxypeptidase C (cathepsin A)